MTALRTFTVMRSRFPLGAPTEQLGTVEAPDLGAASVLARRRFGRDAVVMPEGGAPSPALLSLSERRQSAVGGRRRRA